MDEKKKIEELVKTLNEASEAYYNGQDEIMSNYEWDGMFDELTRLEEKTGYILPESPTQNAGFEESNGEREAHEYPALSLAKTKRISDLQVWAGERPVWLSWKLDGLTLVVTYDNGKLVKILTRGNGTVGSNITFMKDAIEGIPKTVKYKGHLVVRGEAAITYTDFELINDTIEDDDEKYVTYYIHEMKETDTIDTICVKYNTQKSTLEKYNDINNLTSGDKIIIPLIDE